MTKATNVGVVLLAVSILLLAAPAVAQDKVERVPLKFQQVLTSDGDALYGELCAVCHGVDGKGGGPAVKALAIEVPDLTVLAAGHDGEFPAKQVEAVIRGEQPTPAHGSREMPMWGQAFSEVRPDWGQTRGQAFANERIHNLVEQLRSMQAEPPAKSE